MKLKPQCSWCKHHDEFQENTQLRIAVICFKKLCEYILDSPIGSDLVVQSPNGESNNIKDIMQEALDFEDDFKMSSSLPMPPGLADLNKLNCLPGVKTSKSPGKCVKRSRKNCRSSDENTDSPELKCSRSTDISKLSEIPKSPNLDIQSCGTDIANELGSCLNSSSQSDDSIGVIEVDLVDTDTCMDSKSDNVLKRKHDCDHGNKSTVNENSIVTVGSKGSRADNSQTQEPNLNKPAPGRVGKDLKICKCGRGGTNSRLTCLCQRCPCYINKLPCIGCKCKGCRNPRTVEQDKQKMVKIDRQPNSPNIDSIVNSENVIAGV